MRRPLLVSLIVLGLVTTAVGSAGVFATFSDRATTGQNSVTSGERPLAADLKLAWDVSAPSDCATATYSDDITTPDLQETDAQPGFRADRMFCLRNDGSMDLTAAITIIDATDTDTACTGDEGAVDTTCGNDAAGELGSVLSVLVGTLDCTTASGPVPDVLGQVVTGSTHSFGTLAAGATLCGRLEVDYGLNRTQEEVLAAQTDTVTWKYAFDGTTAP